MLNTHTLDTHTMKSNKLSAHTLQEIYFTVKDEMFPTDTSIKIEDAISYIVESGYVDDDAQLIVALLHFTDQMEDITLDGDVMDKQDIILHCIKLADAVKCQNIY